ncbi:AMP-dependent synthetase/ligase [Trema orientale]|uniref:AMP-dependent synthetase/ligase n=1 Tax=Trema orientale TaxID=63057 RepID=A0A2P5FVB9_TREOI|nr:AMP-dependent synthetase/ligase [Trema orientale]
MSLMVSVDQDRHNEPLNMFLYLLPMFHVAGLSLICYSQLRRGNAVVSMEKFKLEKALRVVETYGVTHPLVVLSVMIALAKQSVAVWKLYDLSSLKQILCGGALLGRNVMKKVAQSIPAGVAINQIYGTIETCELVSLENTREESRFSGLSGTLITGIESRIISVETLKLFHQINWERFVFEDLIQCKVAPFKRLRRVSFLSSIPKSASGKILRRELVQKVRSKI